MYEVSELALSKRVPMFGACLYIMRLCSIIHACALGPLAQSKAGRGNFTAWFTQ